MGMLAFYFNKSFKHYCDLFDFFFIEKSNKKKTRQKKEKKIITNQNKKHIFIYINGRMRMCKKKFFWNRKKRDKEKGD
jgi:hypothetical protein